MKAYIRHVWHSILRGDWILLILCLFTTGFGCLAIASATNYMGSTNYVLTQIFAAVIGIIFYALASSVDLEFLSENRRWLVIINLFLLALLIPFGVTINGNRSWIDLRILPMNIQVAEVCKIFFIVILASVMNSHQRRISNPKSVLHMACHMLLIVGVNMVLSGDLGVSLIFAAIFLGMAIGGGVSILWFLGGIVLVAAVGPFVYNNFLGEYQKLRIEVLFNPDLDPLGRGPRYHTVQSLKSLTGGGMTGQGLFSGRRTQGMDTLFARHTDYIYSSIGEEMGFVGCICVLVLLLAIVARIIWVGMRSPDYMRKLVCFGAASAMIFQIIVNVGMCMGVMPVIGLTLPFISYGGSSLVTTYLMLGLVSGVYARPRPSSHERYIRPPYMAAPRLQ